MNIEKIEIIGLYGYLNKVIEFKKGKNFLIGINGSGKTSILRIIDSFVKGDLEFFNQLKFDRIHIVVKKTESDEIKSSLDFQKYPELRFNIFRMEEELMIDCKEYTYGYLLDQKEKLEKDIKQTKIRKEVETLKKDLKMYRMYLDDVDNLYMNLIEDNKYENILSNYKVINFGSEPYNLEKSMLEAIKLGIESKEKNVEIFNKIMYSIQPILKVKRDLENIGKRYLEEASLKLEIFKSKEMKKDLERLLSSDISELDKITYEEEYKRVKKLIDVYEVSTDGKLNIIINEFLKATNLFFGDCSKELKFNSLKGEFYINILDGQKNEIKVLESICLLSSGEQQILCMLVDVYFNIKNNSIIIIDEPEKSMHIEWQSNFMSIVDKLLSLYNDCQVIIATHSADLINSEERECLIGLYPYNTEAIN